MLGAIVHSPGSLARSYWRDFQPRVGVAWNFRPKMVFRGNFGLITQDLFMTSLGQNFEEYLASAAVQAPVGDPRPAFRLSQGPGPVNFNIAPDGSAPFVGTNFSSRNVSWIDPNIRPPYIMNWSGGFQWEATNEVVVETIYQGSAGVGLLNNWDINVLPLNVASDYATLDNIRRNYQNFKPYPQFGSIQLYSNFGHNTYHSATVRVERRYRSGLFVTGFYTWSKNLTDADADGGASGVTYYDRALEKGRSNFDISHRFVGTFIYDLPYGRGPPLGQPRRHRECRYRRLEFDVLPNRSERPADYGYVRGRALDAVCPWGAVRLAAGSVAAEPNPSQRSSGGAGLDDRSQPAADERAKSVS